MIHTLKTDRMTYRISTLGAELISATDSEGNERMHIPEEKGWSRVSPLLFPLCGRLRNNTYTYGEHTYHLSCHGFLPSSETEVVSASESTLVLRLTDSAATREVYPFSFSLTVTYTATGDTLRVSVVIQNTGKEVMPYMFGGHPGLLLPTDNGATGRDWTLDLGAENIMLHPLGDGPFLSGEERPMHLPGGKLRLDPDWIDEVGTAIFTGTAHTVSLSSEKSRHAVTVSFGEEFPYLCFWKTAGREDYLCIEPWSDGPVGDDPERFEERKMSRLTPGNEKTFLYSITYA